MKRAHLAIEVTVTPSTYAAWHTVESSNWLFGVPLLGTRAMGDAYMFSGVVRPFLPVGRRRPGGVR